MSNQIEFNGDGFDAMIGGSEQEVTPETTTETAEIGIGEELVSDDPSTPESQQETAETDLAEDEDFLTSFLSDFGLNDGKVTYENEDGSTEEVSFNELDAKEKLNILRQVTNPGLTEGEIETINYLRNNNASLRDVVEYFSKKAVQDYIDQNGPAAKEYAVDEYSDDELYIADLKAKFADMTEEDLKADLEIAKENEDLFKKKVDTIRKHYKEREEEQVQERVRQQEEQFNNFRSSVQDSLHKFNEVSMDYRDSKSDSLQIEDGEKENIFNYLLQQDENGATQFFKDLNDPNRLVEMAWFALYGKEAISNISSYWKSQLKSSRKEARSQSQTTVVPKDNKNQYETFKHHRGFVETSYGEELL